MRLTGKTENGGSLHPFKGLRHLLWLPLFVVSACQVAPPHKPEVVETAPETVAEEREAQPIRYGDVLMRSLRVWPRSDDDERDTLATAKAFKVDRILWIYENTAEYNQRVRAEGIGIGTTMAANAREMWEGILPRNEIQALVDRFTIRNLKGEQILPAHMRRFTNPYITHFNPEQTDPEWAEYYVDYLEMLYGQHIESIHRDDALISVRAVRAGGTFTDSAVNYFRDYLGRNFDEEFLLELGVTDVETFNVRDHFRSLGAPTDDSLWAWRGSPLMPVYLDAMMEADQLFFVRVRQEVEARTGMNIPWSLNGTGPINPHEEAFDFRIGEFQSHHNQPQTILLINEFVRRAGKMQAFVSIVDKHWETLDTFKPDLRRHIASAYATGAIPLVPWCMYMHDAPRHYGTVEDYGDLYHFVSDYRHFFDEHELVSVSGVDTRARLFSWMPNREMLFDDGDPSARVWINQPNVIGYVRRAPDADHAVVHLVDWNEAPEPFEVAFDPQALVGAATAEVQMLRPGSEPVVLPAYQGQTLELSALNPWGMLVVTPASHSAKDLPAPRMTAPWRGVVPIGTMATFANPGADRVIFARFISDEDAIRRSPPFEALDDGWSLTIPGNGYVEAMTVEAGSDRSSESLRIRFDTFQDHRVEPGEWMDRPGVDVSDRFRVASGELKVNGSFLADEMRLMGARVDRGFSTRGNAVLTAPLEPGWEIFSVRVGIDDAEDRRPCARFQVWFDGALAYETPIINPTKLLLADEERREFMIQLRIPEGVRQMQLRALNGGFFPDQNHFIWAEPTMYGFAGCYVAPPPRPETMETAAERMPEERAADPIRYGDVLMRSLRVWPRGDDDDRDTLATAKAFHVDRILWIYENTTEFNKRVSEEGIGIGTTMASNAREMWYNVIPRNEMEALVERFTIRNLDGEQVLPAQFHKFGDPFVIHFNPDQADPEWADFYVEYLKMLYGQHVETIHRDDPSINSRAVRTGGTFTESSIDFFRNYLAEHYSMEELAALGVSDPETFDLMKHFKSLGAPTDNTLWAWRGSPLMPAFIAAMGEADRQFFVNVRAAVEEATGMWLPWSLNAGGPIDAIEEAFDFRIGEFQMHHNQPQTILQMNEFARRAGKMQAFVSVVERDWETLDTFTPDVRRHIASAYGSGAIPLVPWCMYMRDAPRYYGALEDYGALYHFVAGHREYFDEHELVSVAGIDHAPVRHPGLDRELYSWMPNREMLFDDGDPSVRIWLNQPNIIGYVRRAPAAEHAVVHLVDWNEAPEPFEVTFDPQVLVGTAAAEVQVLRPGAEPMLISDYQGRTLELPALDPWSMLVVTPAAHPETELPTPRLTAPWRGVVPIGTMATFASPGEGHMIMARFIPDESTNEQDFALLGPDANLAIPGNGFVEAVMMENGGDRRSEPMRVRFETFHDYSVEPGEWMDRPGVDVSDRFRAASGELKVNGSFLADEVRLMGSREERGFSTRGHTVLTAPLEPGWEIFSVRVGIDDAEDRRPCARFQVFFDGTLAYETPIINPTKLLLADEERREFPINLRIPEGARHMQLRAINGGFFVDQNHFIWAEPTMYGAD